MARYTELSREDIDKILSRYTIRAYQCVAFEGGAANSSYVLSAPSGRYVLTVFDEKPRTDVVIIGRLLDHLESYGFPATRLVRTVDGAILTDHNDKPVIVKRYVDGKVHTDLDPGRLRQAGQALARLHEIAVPEYLPKDHAYGAVVLPGIIGRNIDPDFESWAARRIPELKTRMPASLPRGLIHGDLFYDNILYQGTRLEALLDFEEACGHFRVFDIGMAIVGTCTRENAIKFLEARALVSGYQQVRTLEPEEKRLLQTFVEYSAATTACWRFWKYHVDTVQPDRRHLHADMQQLAEMVRRVKRTSFLERVF